MSTKLALSDDILMKIEKPERYIGGEVNAVIKDKNKVDVRFAMCFPDVYEIGMSHLGIQILYGMFNAMEDVWCERVYSPWIDLDRIMRREHIPLFALESQEPVKDFDFLGITIQYEMCYTNILQVLDLAGIPLTAGERLKQSSGCSAAHTTGKFPAPGGLGGWPIVIGGGPCTYNPEPIADFFDIFYIGEGETRYAELLALYKKCKKEGTSREEFLYRAAMLPGMYVPMFYDVTYHEDGTIKAFTPLREGLPTTILKEIAMDVTGLPYPMKPVVPYIKVTQDRVVLEIQRGCIRGCRFCQAGQLYRPVRERDVKVLEDYALKMLENTGHEEISLSSLSSSDYSQLPELIDFLIDECKDRHINISLPSLRIDAFSLDVMSKVQDVKKSSLTFAPEAGSQRLRNVINKGLTEEVILKGATLAFEGGWSRVKLYFMLGLPTETEEDIRGIAELSNKIAAAYFETVPKEKRNAGSVQIVASTSFFVPKPFTPFQWAPQCTAEEFVEKAYLTRKVISEQLNQKRIKYNWHEADASVMEGVLARGDRRLGQVIRNVYEKGCYFDAWGEYYDHAKWLETIAECGLDVAFYTSRKRELDEIFPWDFIDCGVTKTFLKREWQKAQEELISENCKLKCQGCGAARFGGGICTEPKGCDIDKEDSVKPDAAKPDKAISDTISDTPSPEAKKKTLQEFPQADGGQKPKNIRLRIKFSKHGNIRFIGHLDVMRYFQKTIRRAGIDVAYTGGFSPHQIMSFAQPLGVGLESNGEYMDVEVASLTSCEEIKQRLNEASVPDIRVLDVVILPDGAGNAMASVAAASYTVRFREGRMPKCFAEADPAARAKILSEFLSREQILIQKQGKAGIREVDIRPGIYKLAWKADEEDALEMLVDASSAGNIKPVQILEAMLRGSDETLAENALLITREETYTKAGRDAQQKLIPLGEVNII
ncbi:MAG: TIGR03960 family B12-binding radical SAM protein [Lachnospiraceae bacterium]|nr:TIGR03960 family B12-binding radical SAM protein [Lachnospiraceae bacterium]